MEAQRSKCGICDRIQQIKDNTNPYFVAEMKSGYVVVGDFQYFRGYSLLLHKEHYCELHELRRTDKMVFLEDMSILSEAVYNTFRPKKINYELLGNSIPHLHWHIFPRHEENIHGPVWNVDKSIRYAESARPSSDELFIIKTNLLKGLQQIAPEKITICFTK